MTREQIPSMSVLPLPFAMKGETVVPVSELDPFSDSGNEGALGFDSKYQWNGSVPPERFVTRQLMNRLLGQISGRQFLKQCGSLDVFDQNICDAIGGYPRGSVLQYLDGNVLYDVVSMRDNNDTDYTKIGVDGINWKIYGSSVFTYVYPDYGSVGQDNILKQWRIDTGGDWTYQFSSSSYENDYFVSDLSIVSVNETKVWQITLRRRDDPYNGTPIVRVDHLSTESSTDLEFIIWPNITVEAHKDGSQVYSDDLAITSPCWVEAFLTEPRVSATISDYECGIILYGGNSSSPSSIPEYNNASYTVRELSEGGTVSIAVFPVLPGDKITAFANKNGAFPCDLVIRKLTPTRTR